MKKTAVLSVMIALCILTACAKSSRLTVKLDEGISEVEVSVSVTDSNGKEVCGGSFSDGGAIVAALKDGTYTVTVTDVSGDRYKIPEPEEVELKNIAHYTVRLEEK